MGSLGPYRGQRRQHTFRDPPGETDVSLSIGMIPRAANNWLPAPANMSTAKNTCGVRDAVLFWVCVRSFHIRYLRDISIRGVWFKGGRTSLSPDVGAVRPAPTPIPASFDAAPFANGNPTAPLTLACDAVTSITHCRLILSDVSSRRRLEFKTCSLAPPVELKLLVASPGETSTMRL